MVVPYVEKEETDNNYVNLEKIIRQNNITDEQKADLYNNNFKKIINQSSVKANSFNYRFRSKYI